MPPSNGNPVAGNDRAPKMFADQAEHFGCTQTPAKLQAASRRRAWWQPSLEDIDDEDLRRQSARLAALGPRATYEFCRGLLSGRDIIESLACFERLDPGVLAYLGGDRLPVTDALR